MKSKAKIKTTLHGVDHKKTRELFTELKKRGFKVSLEDGGKQWKIRAFINGIDFVISAVNMVYSKPYSRNSREWTKFDRIDDLVISSTVKKDSQPTEKQLNYISLLCDEIAAKFGYSIKTNVISNVIEANECIKELKHTSLCLSYDTEPDSLNLVSAQKSQVL